MLMQLCENNGLTLKSIAQLQQSYSNICRTKISCMAIECSSLAVTISCLPQMLEHFETIIKHCTVAVMKEVKKGLLDQAPSWSKAGRNGRNAPCENPLGLCINKQKVQQQSSQPMYLLLHLTNSQGMYIHSITNSVI